VTALAATGRAMDAKAVLSQSRGALSPLGLLSEDYDPLTQQMRGSFPHASSHVGFIHAAFAASDAWAELI
jgi:GH15 family glucan-1,4-alpha-glucosidase